MTMQGNDRREFLEDGWCGAGGNGGFVECNQLCQHCRRE